jgi:hypothetical protein
VLQSLSSLIATQRRQAAKQSRQRKKKEVECLTGLTKTSHNLASLLTTANEVSDAPKGVVL